MTLGPGSSVGSYRILAPIGEGGMGVVYRAQDSRLEREVALKLLPEAFTADPERLARFEREAKLLAQLNHPNIAQIYGLETSGEAHALVMELVDGPTLGDRLAQGALPLDESLLIARQIAEALEEAHEKGIVHRDLKPQNVKASIEGKTKVLDFGLAKAMDAGASGTGSPAASPTMMQSPTLTAAHGTQLGVILGTAAYMAPEQARGGAVDKRADIWAFGVVLWEMLTGRRLFEGETVSDTLAAVLRAEVDYSALPATAPPALRSLLRRCLERNPKNRLHDIADARIVLDEILAGPSEGAAAPPAAVAAAPGWRRHLPWAVAALGLALGTAGLLTSRTAAAPEVSIPPTTRFTLFPPAPGEIEGYPALSPDGRSLAYCFVPERGVARLWLHSFDSGTSRELPGTEHAGDPFWSPDGRYLGFFAAGALRRIEVATSLAQSVVRVSDARGGTWTGAEEIVFTPTSSAALLRVPASGGSTRPLTRLGSGEQSHRFPWALPGGEGLLFYTLSGKEAGIHWLSAASGERRLLLPDASRAAYDGRGFLFWSRNGALVAQRFDPGRAELSGEVFVVAEQVGVDAQKSAQTWFGAAPGAIALRVGALQQSQLRWFDRSGAALDEVTSAGAFGEPALSADDGRVVVTRAPDSTGARDVWIFDTSGRDRGLRLSFEGDHSTPVWSADERAIYYTVESEGVRRIVTKRADGSGAEQELHRSEASLWPNSQSPRAPLLVVEGGDAETGYRLWLLPLEGERRLRPFQQGSSGSQAHAAFSPDGSLLAYTSDESGLPQVFVQPVEGSGVRWQVSSDGGDLALWRADGRELYYVGLDRVLRAVPVRSLAPFAVGEPETLFPLRVPPLASTGNRTVYAPSRDGRRFLVNDQPRAASEPGIRVILGWRPPAPSGRGAGAG